MPSLAGHKRGADEMHGLSEVFGAQLHPCSFCGCRGYGLLQGEASFLIG